MIGIKEEKKHKGNIIPLKNHINVPAVSHQSCGGCNSCHQMTGIHSMTATPIFGGNGDENKGSGIQKSCASNFFQRNLGNSYMQSLAGNLQTVSKGNGQTLQRKCSCGGSCSGCSGEEELEGVQTKLKIGSPNDVYEQEADRVAEQVMRMADPFVMTGNDQPPGEIGIRRIAEKGGTKGSTADFKLNSSGGRLLSESTRNFMEPRFGTDFRHVRLHTGHNAHQKASQIQARAFTYGNNIWLGRGESEQNKNLMAHELTHVVQQKAALPTHQASLTAVRNSVAVPHVQPARLPCTSRKKIDVFGVNLPGSTGSIYSDVTNANSVLCQCGIELNVVGGQSWQTNLLDLDPPRGVLNAPSGTVRPLTREENQMLAYKPGGDVIHVYYVPSFSGPKVAESFWPSQHGETAFAVSNTPNADSFAHEMGHVLLDSGNHHRDQNNLMASGSIRNAGVDELEQSQCNRMP